jgi:predicted nucleic-acid-binding protein
VRSQATAWLCRLRSTRTCAAAYSSAFLVLLETEWVLRSRYSLAKSEILAAFSGLLAPAELRFEDEHSIEDALFSRKDSPADFADCLIGARHRAHGCRATASFDAKATKLPGLIAA